ncbi:MAG: hypothetical protein H0A75_07070 [Candidatus Methanofishera endochildressiae]|uniref:Uncharacterized protein n=1 Tax=Candidatus Methanofishera endochildressiae TaxID=2738884 RepID=A0A7Z0MPA0_9GAMM|nr:hypothetical protein [Candidatus Methanofishera endochildressiae]
MKQLDGLIFWGLKQKDIPMKKTPVLISNLKCFYPQKAWELKQGGLGSHG